MCNLSTNDFWGQRNSSEKWRNIAKVSPNARFLYGSCVWLHFGRCRLLCGVVVGARLMYGGCVWLLCVLG